MAGNGRVRLSALSSGSRSPRKDKVRKERKSDLGSISHTKSGMVPRTSGTSSRGTIYHKAKKRPFISTPLRNLAPESSQTRSSRLQAIVQILVPQGFSNLDAEAVANSLREGSNKVYEGKWARFTKWCEDKQINPIQASLPEITSFLRYLRMEVGLSYSAILGYRSALNQIFIQRHYFS